MDRKRKTAVLCAVILLISVFLAGCSTGTEETITIGKDLIPTLYSVVGHRTRTGTSTATENGTVTKSVTYAGLTKEDVQSYIDALAADGYIQTEGTKVDGNAQSLQIAIESSTEGKVILIDIAFDPQSSTTLTYTVTDGTLTRE